MDATGIRILAPLQASDDLFTHNDPPEDSRNTEIADYLARARHRIHSIESQILALTKERDKLLKDVQVHAGVVSVIRRFPTELWCRIFLMTRPRRAIMELPKAPWALALVCKRWREIVVGLPALWSAFGFDTTWYFDMEGYAIHPDHSPVALERTMEQLHRAGNEALEVVFEGASTEDSEPFKVLRGVMERWETVSFRGTPPWLKDSRHRLCALRRLCVSPSLKFTTHAAVKYPITFEFSVPPRSSGAALSMAYDAMDVGFALRPLASDVQWDRLTHYAGPITLRNFAEFMLRACHLTDCRLTFEHQKEAALTRPAEIVHLPFLRSLSLSLSASCLQCISAPGLQELSIDSQQEWSLHGLTNDVVNFITRSACTLLRLSLFEISTDYTIFQAVPALTELTVIDNHSPSIDPLVQHLLKGSEGTNGLPILPHLEALSMRAVLSKFLPSVVELLSTRFHDAREYQQLRFCGMFLDIHRSKTETKFRRTAAVDSLLALQSAGLQLGFVKGRKKFELMKATDPFSMRRCCTENLRTLSTEQLQFEYAAFEADWPEL
ncbi:hypothetical protein R3P38DRAFT_2851335 [Favolaschia claudopus]|uniref:F-box domain-containing protein n=1 Tax=Favolaschia claudopus TaxID=2862362 RepID=A0AAW0DLJ1_9AGAR